MKYGLLFFILTGLFGCFSREPEKTKQQGNRMPAFKLLLSDSITMFDSENIPNDQAAVLFVFSPTCPYCRAQTEEIISDMSDLKDIHFYMITTGSFAYMKHYIQHYSLQKYPNITVGFDEKNFVGDYFETAKVPYIAFYNKNKKLNKAFIGKLYTSEILKAAKE